MSRTRTSAWWRLCQGRGDARLRLAGFAYAGGSAALFRAWPPRLPDDVDVYGVQLPGHGTRIDEPPVTSLCDLVPPLAAALAVLLDQPCVFFGHSLGAILGFEVSRWLRRHGYPLPAHLFVSGRRAPQLPDSDPPTHGLSDQAFIARLRDLNGTPPEVLQNQPLLAVRLPVLRADFALGEAYTCDDDLPLACPITAFGGSGDEETEGDRLTAWASQTTAAFTAHRLPGDHFFIHSREADLLALVRADLERLLAPDVGQAFTSKEKHA